MEKGTIKWFNPDRNYGFIERDEGPDVFVHGSEIEGAQLPKEGDRVSFKVEAGDRGPKATNVTIE
jgi:CspA family cold shock protein